MHGHPPVNSREADQYDDNEAYLVGLGDQLGLG